MSGQNLDTTQAKAIHEPLPAVPSRRKRHLVFGTLLFVGIFAFLWLTTSSNPFAKVLQGFAGNKPDQALVAAHFSVAPHSFRYYKFSLPEGSKNVAIVGSVSAIEDVDAANGTSSSQLLDSEKGIDIYVQSERAFANWQTGHAASSALEGGRRMSQGTLQLDLPSVAGVYYLVFSNRFSSNTGKKVQATVVLRHKSWVSDCLRKIQIHW